MCIRDRCTSTSMVCWAKLTWLWCWVLGWCFTLIGHLQQVIFVSDDVGLDAGQVGTNLPHHLRFVKHLACVCHCYGTGGLSPQYRSTRHAHTQVLTPTRRSMLTQYTSQPTNQTRLSARTSTNYINSNDPRRMWSFLESIGAVTRPPTGNERERERERGCKTPIQYSKAECVT